MSARDDCQVSNQWAIRRLVGGDGLWPWHCTCYERSCPISWYTLPQDCVIWVPK